MTDSNHLTSASAMPSAEREKNRMARECAVCISKLGEIHDKLINYYTIIDEWDSCQEVVAAVAKLHADHATLLKKATDIYHQYVRKRSLQEWEELRREALDAAKFELTQPPIK